MKHIHVLAALLFSVTATIHAETTSSTARERQVIGIADQSGSAIGLSFMSPDEPGWETKKSGLSITMKSNGQSAEENQEIDAYMIRLDVTFQPVSAYMHQIRQNTEDAYKMNGDFALRNFEIKEYSQNSQCVRIYMMLEDIRTARAERGKRWSEQHMLSCGLSKHKRIGFEVRYTQRYYDQNKDDQFAAKADRLFATVIIEDK